MGSYLKRWDSTMPITFAMRNALLEAHAIQHVVHHKQPTEARANAHAWSQMAAERSSHPLSWPSAAERLETLPVHPFEEARPGRHANSGNMQPVWRLSIGEADSCPAGVLANMGVLT